MIELLKSSNKKAKNVSTHNERITRLEEGHITLQESIADFDVRLTAVENIGDTITDIKTTIDKGLRHLKLWAPTIVGAAISAGIVNGKLGAFLRALFVG